MSNWGKPVLTKQGLKLQAKVDAGSRMQLTKCMLGSGTLSSGQSLENLTGLITPVQTLSIASISYSENNGACVITAVTDNSNVSTGYYLREFGIFARDPNDGEILYAVAQDANPDYIPPSGTSAVVSQEIGVALSFSNAANVTAQVNTSAIATVTYVNDYVTSAVADLKDMNGATAARPGVHGLVPAPAAGATKNRFLQADGTWAVVPDLTGATTYAAGAGGLVPAPAAGNNTRYLRSDGTWASITAMSGATATVNGAAGLVPAPVAGSSIRYLCADGTWKEVDLDSAKTKLVTYN
ncbi:phage tail-collar fiber domain-containing protein [Phascolarctobacterium succinatutens]|uniref:phage tail-collar fiber domain-containing protein n=1 Tax=Phascolarctobacterium succinatutens TaxID=626940 RepID=UPI0026EAF6B8|nr:phage tail protein [Phascolarctobacterium succinatutens]